MKGKIEKDKSHIMHEIADVRAATDEITRSKASAEKSHKALSHQLNEIGKKVEETNLILGDYDAQKRKIASENSDLLRHLQELENSAIFFEEWLNAGPTVHPPPPPWEQEI